MRDVGQKMYIKYFDLSRVGHHTLQVRDRVLCMGRGVKTGLRCRGISLYYIFKNFVLPPQTLLWFIPVSTAEHY